MFDQNAPRTGNQPLEQTLSASNSSLLTGVAGSPYDSGAIAGSLAVANGSAVVGNLSGNLSEINVPTLTKIWADPTASVGVQGCFGTPSGIVSTPAIWGNEVIVGTGASPGQFGYGWVRAYDLTGMLAGHLIWSRNLSAYGGSGSGFWGGAYTWSSPVVWDGSVYIGLASGCDNPLIQGQLFRLNAATGGVNAVFAAVPSGETGASIWSSPSIDAKNNTVWITTGNGNKSGPYEKYGQSLIALNATTLAVIGWAQEGTLGIDSDFGAGPTLFSNPQGTPIVVTVNKNGYEYAFDRANFTGNMSPSGSVKGWLWTKDVGGPQSPGAIAPSAFGGGQIYTAGGSLSFGPNSYSYGGLPTGCLSQNLGMISCAPSAGDTSKVYPISVTVTSPSGQRTTASTSLTITTVGALAINSFSASPPTISVGNTVQLVVSVSGGSSPYTYVYAGLPSGCSTSSTAVLDCTPTAGGQATITVTVTDRLSHSTYSVLTMAVLPESGALEVASMVAMPPSVVASGTTTIIVQMVGTPNLGSIYSVSPSGATNWHVGVPGYVRAAVSYANGLVISAGIWSSNNGSTITLLNAQTGAVVTEYNVSGEVNGEPAIADGRIYFGTAYYNPVTEGFTSEGYVYALGIPLAAQPTVAPILTSGFVYTGATPSFSFDGLGIGGSPPYTCGWTFGDGAKSSSCGIVDHTYSASGAYTAAFSVTDSAGSQSSLSVSLFAYTSSCLHNGPLPCPSGAGGGAITFSPCSAGSPLFCLNPLVITFCTNVTGGFPPYTYLWTFGDEESSELPDPVHTYANPGEYTVTLAVTDSEHNVGSFQFTVSVA
jgi:PKD repeat protein